MGEHEQHINITIDKKHYSVSVATMTGSQLKTTGNVPSDYELWFEVPSGTDRQISDMEEVHLKSGNKFFSVPLVINPGAGE